MLKGLVIFGAGVYVGVYITQNYEIDKVENPAELYNKASNYIKDITGSGSCGDGKK